jgi:hypothetical protein
MELLEVKLSYILTAPGQTTILARYYRLDPEGNVGRDADCNEPRSFRSTFSRCSPAGFSHFLTSVRIASVKGAG